jgi:hypothetical protein
MSNFPITPGQKVALSRLINVSNDDKRLWIASQLVGREITSFNDLLLDDWRGIRDRAYPHWEDQDWTPGPEFRAKLAALNERYDEEISGQLRLF